VSDSQPILTAREAALALIDVAPKLLMALALILAIVFFHGPATSLMERSSKIGLGPVSLEMAEEKLAVMMLDEHDPAFARMSEQHSKTLAAKFSEVAAAGKAVNLLWADDTGDKHRQLVDFLDHVGFRVDLVASHEEARQRMAERSYGVVIFDISPAGGEGQASAADMEKAAQLAGAVHAHTCENRLILFSPDAPANQPLPPHVVAHADTAYFLLLEVAELAMRPADPDC
jgi:CheY-like chemotaxis protein